MGTTPTYALRYPASTEPADVPTDMQELALDVEAALKAPVTSYGTSLPASPVNGQEAILVDANPPQLFVWRFRFNSSDPTYKWEFVGGIPLIKQETSTVAIPTNPVAWGKSVATTLPRNGVYTAQVTTEVITPVAGADAQVRHGFSPTSDLLAATWNANVIWRGTITQGMSPLVGFFTVTGAPVSWSHFIWSDVASLTSARRSVVVTPWAVS